MLSKPLCVQKLRALLEPLHLQHSPHPTLFTPLFEELTGCNLLKLGQQVHAFMALRGILPNGFLAAKMVAMYASSGDLDSAVFVFDRIQNPTSLLFNSMIRAYAKYGYSTQCVQVYCKMHGYGFVADNFTYPFILKSCTDPNFVPIGRCVHGQSMRSGCDQDMYVGTSLIDMYVKCGELIYAQKVFEEMPKKDISSWNALINGCMKIGEVAAAEALFQTMPSKNIVSWTSMVSGYTQNNLPVKAFKVFDEMTAEDSKIKPNWVTIMSVLPSCAHSAALERGRRVHEYARKIGLDLHPSVRIALISMYARCGSLEEACNLFKNLCPKEKSCVAWNTMITSYALHGQGARCVSAVEEMIRSGVDPNSITFTGLLSGCSHSGLTDTGLRYFNSMSKTYAIEPQYEHYACTVDLLGRAGKVVEAKELIDHMPMEPSQSIWGALLAACRKTKNLEIAELAANKLFVLEPDNTGNYVLLSNIYAEFGIWKEVDRLRNKVKSLGMKKSPGCSWIEVYGKAHLFMGGGEFSHPQAHEILLFLESLPEKMKVAGYFPDTSFSLHDVSEEEKEQSLSHHSEKLAIAFGLLNTSSGEVLRVTKNLRICGDCHTTMMFLSKMYEREIVVRDVSRFHHFRDGACSCGDYW